MTSSIKLIVKTGDEINESFDLIKDKNIVGRDPESDIVINDIEISRNHLVITRDGETFQIEDLNSTNGSFLNGKKLKKLTDIKNGDLISLGENHALEFVVEKIDEVPEPSQLDQEEPLEEVTRDEEETNKVEDSQKERAPKIKPDTNNRKKKTLSQKAGDQKKPTWIVILLAALAFIVIFCVIPLIVIDVTDQWCNLFAGFFNSMNPGVCP